MWLTHLYYFICYTILLLCLVFLYFTPAAALPGFPLHFYLFIFHSAHSALCLLVTIFSSFSYKPMLQLCLVPHLLLFLFVFPAALPCFTLHFFLLQSMLLLCFVSLYFSFSYYPCCCFSVFLFPLLLFLFVFPAALPCSLYSSLSYNPCCCSVFLFHFTLLYLITPAALSSCSLYSSLSYYPCCCSVFLFPLLFFIL